MIRRQLPAYSPSRISDQAGALVRATTGRGEPRDALQAYLVDRFDAVEARLYASGTMALTQALRWSRVQSSAPVALPAYSCFDLVSAARGADAPILFYDVDPTTLAPEPSTLRAALEAGARTVVAGNLYGFPLDWASLRATAGEYGALLVEDAAQGLGADFEEREAGSFGDLTVLSFGRGKGWTGGGGGALLLRRPPTAPLPGAPDPAPVLAGAKAALTSFALWALGRPSLYRIPTALPGLGLGETHYHPPRPPTEIPAFCAALALSTARTASGAVPGRRRRAAELDGLFAENSMRANPCRAIEGGRAGYLRYPALARSGAEARELLAAGRDLGVGPPYPRTLDALDASSPLRVSTREKPFPGASTLAERLVTLPTHPRVRSVDVERLRGLFRDDTRRPPAR